MPSLAEPRSAEKGLTTAETLRMAGPRIAAARSGLARAILFGRSSPKRSMAELTKSVPATMPMVWAHGAAIGHLLEEQGRELLRRPTRRGATPATTEVRVSQNCTRPRNLPGCSAMTSAASAPSPPDSTIRLSLAFRAETNAVSAAVIIPLAMTRSPRISNSFAALNIGWPHVGKIAGRCNPAPAAQIGAKRLAFRGAGASLGGHARRQRSPQVLRRARGREGGGRPRPPVFSLGAGEERALRGEQSGCGKTRRS